MLSEHGIIKQGVGVCSEDMLGNSKKNEYFCITVINLHCTK